MSKGIEWLRSYLSPERWSPVGPDDDYQIFGDMRLSDLRALEADIAAVEAQCRALVEDGARLNKLAACDGVDVLRSNGDVESWSHAGIVASAFRLRQFIDRLPTPEPARDAE